MTHRNIGVQVKKLRKSKGIGRDEFAHKLGLSIEQYKNLERGRKEIDESLLKSIQNILGEKITTESSLAA